MAAEALDDWVRAMAAFGTAGAIGLMIHRADALLAVLAAFDRRFGAITILPVAPAAGAAANRIIVSGRKGNGAPLRLLPPLIVHGEDDRYRPEVDAIVRGGGALTVS
jgi:tRNA1(Val) A37 N6-methylase TrmN6